MLLLLLFFVVVFSRDYPLYKQCDGRWGSEKIGTSTKTICEVGCLMSSVSMALSGFGHSENPGTLNKWLIDHHGYISGDLFVWASVDASPFNFKFDGFEKTTDGRKKKLDEGKVVILNVMDGRHWVLATGYTSSAFKVNDPGFSKSEYPFGDVVNSGVYTG